VTAIPRIDFVTAKGRARSRRLAQVGRDVSSNGGSVRLQLGELLKLQTTAAFLTIALAPTLAVAAPGTAPEAILKLTTAVIQGANAGDVSAFTGLFTDDAVVVDENPPFVWRGSAAGVAWWQVVEDVTQKAKIGHLKAINVRIGEFKQSATDAYLVEALTVTGVTGGKPFAESGTMTYTFHNAGGNWLISTMVWTTKP
jgi:ketosteroid isomerase-like protein